MPFSYRDTLLSREFLSKGLIWPCKEVYIRIFKHEKELEIWIKDDSIFRLYKVYKICMESGTLGPKRLKGDYQIPEGFYYIDKFNPSSNYHLSLKINYPNSSDKILSDSTNPGDNIFIHGDCVSVGCIPIGNESIEELYDICYHAKMSGEDFIPVHIFPIKFDVKESCNYIKFFDDNNLWLKLKQAFDFFGKNKTIPIVMTNKLGDYIIN